MSEEVVFDLIVIGAGPGGYVAAIRGAQLGMKVAVVEKRSTPGGVCLNEGCIPSKALLDSSELFSLARDKFSLHGITVDAPGLDLAKMMSRKTDVVKKLTDGITFLLKKNGITRFEGVALLKGANGPGNQQVAVAMAGETALISASKVILATGSDAAGLPGIPFDGELVVSAREALSFTAVPEHLIVAGGGVIGLELGSVWRRLGARVTVIEMLPNLLPTMDRQVAEQVSRSLRKQGIQFKLGTKITGLVKNGERGTVQFDGGNGTEELVCDKLLVAVGRRPVTGSAGLAVLGITLTKSGRVAIDEDYQTSVPGIYAIGDLVDGPMLAHKASEEGVVCVERMSGMKSLVEYDIIPGVVYTWPEAASVGQSEEQLKEGGVAYQSGRFNFAALGRARCMDESEGFVKILADQETDRVLGVHIVGPRAWDLFSEAVAVMSFNGTARDIGLTCHGHPTLSEAMREAALDLHKEAIHG